ncbi:MAG: hypothetical protein ACK50L_09700 [Bacteroidota bacterium]
MGEEASSDTPVSPTLNISAKVVSVFIDSSLPSFSKKTQKHQ